MGCRRTRRLARGPGLSRRWDTSANHGTRWTLGRMIPADIQIRLGLIIPEGRDKRNFVYVTSCFHAYRIVAHKAGQNCILPAEAPGLAEAVRAAVKLPLAGAKGYLWAHR